MATDKDKAPEQADKPAPGAEAPAGVDEVQARADRETAQGFRGIEADPTPNSAYTVPGVTAGEPTPETDEEQADRVRAEARRIERGEAGTV